MKFKIKDTKKQKTFRVCAEKLRKGNQRRKNPKAEKDTNFHNGSAF